MRALTKEETELEGGAESEGGQSRSLRCCGRSPSGPPADPAGKDMTARETCDGESVMGVIAESGREREVEEGGGCRAHKDARVSSLTGARESSEQQA